VDSSIGLAVHCLWDFKNKAKQEAPIFNAFVIAFSNPPEILKYYKIITSEF